MRRLTPAESQGVSLSVATGLYGISFGALAVTAGLDVWQVAALSLLMFTGGSQFAFIGVLSGGGGGAAALGAASLLGMRNAVYGMQINALVQPGLKPLAAHVTIDESTAIGLAQRDPDERRRGFWVTGIGILSLWSLFSVVGALLGSSIGDPQVFGLDGAAVAAFLGLLWPRLKGREPWALAVVAAVATVVVVPWVPAGVPILVAAAVAAAWGWWVPDPARRSAGEDGRGVRRPDASLGHEPEHEQGEEQS